MGHHQGDGNSLQHLPSCFLCLNLLVLFQEKEQE
jgi:hypothetical protein